MFWWFRIYSAVSVTQSGVGHLVNRKRRHRPWLSTWTGANNFPEDWVAPLGVSCDRKDVAMICSYYNQCILKVHHLIGYFHSFR